MAVGSVEGVAVGVEAVSVGTVMMDAR